MLKRSIATIITLALSQPTFALNFQFDYSLDTNNFFDASKKSVLESAGDYFSSIINDSLAALPTSGGNWAPIFSNPATGISGTAASGACTTTPGCVNNLPVAADTLVIFTGGRDLGGSTLGRGGPGGFSSFGSSSFNTAVSTRGEPGVGTTDFAPWGGSITFDSDTNWYVDSDTSTDEAFTDFDLYSVALHELGHLLGIGTSTSWNNQISGTEFTGSNSVALTGSNVSLDSGQGHWATGLTSTINGVGSFEVAMDPNISSGVRKHFTDLDIAGLQDVGWDIEVAAIPIPPALWMFGASLIALARRKKLTSS